MATLDLILRRRYIASTDAGIVLPAGYTKKEWLKSGGGVVSLSLSLNYFTWETTLKWTSLSKNQLMGNNNAFFGLNTNNGWRSNNTLQTFSYEDFGTASTTDEYKSIFKRTKSLITWEINGVTVTNSVSTASASTLYLFNISASGNYKCYVKMGETKIYDADDVLVSHLIPCIDSDNQSGMYDVVRKMFFTNSAFTTE